MRYIGLGILVLSKLVLGRCRGKVRESGVCEQFALIIVRVVLGRCRGKVRENGVCEQFALCIFVIVFMVIVLVRLSELRFGGMGLGIL